MALDGQVAVITGGASGIGLALAREFGKRGASIVIADLHAEACEQAAENLAQSGVESLCIPCDVTDPEAVDELAKRAFSWHGRVDIVVNNAGISQPRSKLPNAQLADAGRVMDVNFWGVWHGCAAFGPLLAQQDHPGLIYNVGSENSLYCAVPQAAAYIASKHAVLGMTESFREDMPEHVHVGTIMPGWVATGLTPDAVADMAMTAEDFARIAVPQMLARERYVVSHPYNAVRNAERHDAIADSYARNAPRRQDDDRYDVRKLIEKMRRP